MKIAIYGNSLTENYFEFANQLFQSMQANEIEFIVHVKFYNYLKPHLNFSKEIITFSSNEDLGEVSYLFSIGGDGTLLETVTLIKDSGIPVLGINTGRLGFLTTATTENVEQTIQDVINKSYKLDVRSLLSLEIDGDVFADDNYALNEITLQKKDTSSMITINAYLDGEYLNSYWADGLIISTPTGSTAYSLSCNGPIILPRSGNIIINPIAPHNLNVRPLVVPDDSELVFKVEGRTENFLVALDSRSESIPISSELRVKKAEHNLNLIRLKQYEFLNTLRSKLMWGMDKRNY
ncbi:MAG: NAD kinase [Vicingaceae bacterium]|nr:NAD kinase [Vicingaceae bacterium]